MIKSLNNIIDIEDILLRKAMKKTSIEELSNIGINSNEMIKQQTADFDGNKADQKFVDSFIAKTNEVLE